MIQLRFRWRLAAGFALSLTAFACVSAQTVVVWEKAGATDAELEAARETCEHEPGADRVRVGRERMEAELRGNAFVRCMEASGWIWKTEPQQGG